MNSAADFETASRLAHVQPLRGLAVKATPAHTAIIVVDVQNDFCAQGGMMWKEGLDLTTVQEMAAKLPDFLDRAREAGVLVIFVRNIYSTDTNFYLSDTWLEQAARKRAGSYTTRPVCAAGSWEGDFYGNVRPHASDPIVTKHRYSAFYNTDLDTILRANGIRTLVFTGVATNVCIETTAREGFVRDYYVVVTKDGSACYSPEDQQSTLRNIDRYFGEVAELGELAELWASERRP